MSTQEEPTPESSASYADAGVSIAAGDAAVKAIGASVRSTYRPEVLGDIGGFGGLFQPQFGHLAEPVLVSSTDGVGTKSQVATLTGKFDTIGIDLVAMCVDDLVCQGAEPLFFLDYVSVGKLDPDHAAALVEGVAEGCRQAGCALVGGEMAEHPGMMQPGEFDLVGFSVGVVDKSKILTSETVTPGDVIIGLHSPGLRSNGYSLARNVFFDRARMSVNDPAWEGASATLGDELLTPSVIYSKAIMALLAEVPVHGVAHITGGGMPGNINRVLNDNTAAQIDPTSWEAPRIFDELQRLGNIAEDEMRSVFNLGIGMAVIVPADHQTQAMAVLEEAGHRPRQIGEVIPGAGDVIYA